LGGTSQITATVEPDDATIQSVEWSVDNEDIATIDQDGLLTAKDNGSVVVTATSVDNPDVKGEITIHISGQSAPVQTVLIDFGPEGNTDNCKPTDSPDENGNHWNNFTGSNTGDHIGLNNILGSSTGITITTTQTFSVNP